MAYLVAGIVIFLGVHSVRIVRPKWREEKIRKLGEQRYKNLYTALSLIGFVLIIVGYMKSRMLPEPLWYPPASMHHATAALSWVAFVLMAASGVPDNRVKVYVRHPMSLAVVVWSFSHLLSNPRIGDVLLFGSFLLWSIAAFSSAWLRDTAVPSSIRAGADGRVIRVLIGGTVVWAIFGLLLHRYLIGIHPFGWF